MSAEYPMASEMQRRPLRYLVAVPVVLEDATLRVTGTVYGLSSTGGHVANASSCPPVGTQLRCRLLKLRENLGTSGSDSIDLTARVARHTELGFAIEFREAAEIVEGLLSRALKRGKIGEPS